VGMIAGPVGPTEIVGARIAVVAFLRAGGGAESASGNESAGPTSRVGPGASHRSASGKGMTRQSTAGASSAVRSPAQAAASKEQETTEKHPDRPSNMTPSYGAEKVFSMPYRI
jgi:hypothetical protein